MKTVDTVGLLILDGDRLLLGRRGLHKTTFPGVVVVPGGHVESGESLEEACKRELKEELDLECSKFIEMIPYSTPIEVQNVHYYICGGWTGVPKALRQRRCSLSGSMNWRLLISLRSGSSSRATSNKR